MSDETIEIAPEAPGQKSRRRGRRRRRAGLVVLLSFAVVVLGLPILVMSLTGASVNAPDWMATRIEERLNQQTGDVQVSLGGVELVIDRGLRPRILIHDVGVLDGTGAEIARLNQLRARLAPVHSLLKGTATMSALHVSGAQLTVRRGSDGTINLSLGAGAGTNGTLAGVLDSLDKAFAQKPLASLVEMSADQLTITLEDSRSGRLWQVTDGKILLTQSDESLDLSVTADVFNGTEELATVVIGFRTEKGSPQASLVATFENALAADIAAQSPALSFLGVLDAPISGALRATIGTDGELAGFAGTLAVGQGALQPGPDTPPIAFESGRAYVAYDPIEQRLSFSQVSVESETARLTAEGQAYLQDFTAGWPATMVGQFAISNARVHPKDMFAEPMTFAKGAVDFRMRLNPFTVDIGQVALLNDAQRFHGKGRIVAEDAGWNVALDLSLNTIPLERLLALWPVSVAKGTRDWLARNVLSGDISDLAGAFRLVTGSSPQISLSYHYGNATVKALAALPPIEDAAGYASLTGKTYTMVIEEGGMTAAKGGRADMRDSVLRIPDVTANPSRAEIDLHTDSTIIAALSLLDQKPFTLMQKAGLPVELADGRAKLRAQIGFDILKHIALEDVSYSVAGDLLDMTSDVLVERRTISADRLDLRADPTGISIAGAGALGEVPANVTWSQKFGPDQKGKSQVEGTIEISQAFLDEFDIGLPAGSVSGRGVAQVAVNMEKGVAPRFRLQSDLNRLGLSLQAISWSKPRNRTGTLEVEGRLGDQPAIDRISINAPGLTASGVIDLAPNGALATAQFDRVRVGGWLDGPVTLTGRGANLSPAVAVTGGQLDMRAASFGSSGGSGSSAGAESETGPLTLSLNRLTVSEGIALTDFRGDFKAGRGLNGRFSARVNGGPRVEGTVVATPSGGAIELTSEDAGGTLAAADILGNARGGRLNLTLNPTGAEGVYDGRLGIWNTRIVKAPALTELLSAISIIGLVDQMNARGILLSDVEAEFRLTPERLSLYRSSAIGPSLGISLDGLYDLKNERMDMQGVVSPVYFLNGIGQIFSRGRDGLFGFSFRLRGDANAPRVSVNPLSILTPGMFREIFRRAPPEPN